MPIEPLPENYVPESESTRTPQYFKARRTATKEQAKAYRDPSGKYSWSKNYLEVARNKEKAAAEASAKNLIQRMSSLPKDFSDPKFLQQIKGEAKQGSLERYMQLQPETLGGGAMSAWLQGATSFLPGQYEQGTLVNARLPSDIAAEQKRRIGNFGLY